MMVRSVPPWLLYSIVFFMHPFLRGCFIPLRPPCNRRGIPSRECSAAASRTHVLGPRHLALFCTLQAAPSCAPWARAGCLILYDDIVELVSDIIPLLQRKDAGHYFEIRHLLKLKSSALGFIEAAFSLRMSKKIDVAVKAFYQETYTADALKLLTPDKFNTSKYAGLSKKPKKFPKKTPKIKSQDKAEKLLTSQDDRFENHDAPEAKFSNPIFDEDVEDPMSPVANADTFEQDASLNGSKSPTQEKPPPGSDSKSDANRLTVDIDGLGSAETPAEKMSVVANQLLVDEFAQHHTELTTLFLESLQVTRCQLSVSIVPVTPAQRSCAGADGGGQRARLPVGAQPH